MKRIIILFLSSVLIYHITFSQIPTNDPHWQLKWEDNFDTFNTNKWIKADSSSNENRPQLYLANQVWTSGGNLVIEWNNSPITCPTPVPTAVVCEKCIAGKTYKYRSGYVQTKPAYNTQFGYIEARIKFPYKKGKEWGFWPAFWVWRGGDLLTWSNAAEIDICEIFARNRPPDHFQMGVGRAYDPNRDWDGPFTYQSSNFSYKEWHTYAIEWNPARLIWYLDGKAIASVSNHRIVDPIRIILNLAVLKNSWPDSQYQPPTTGSWSDKMEVDWVKVYSLKCDDKNIPLTINSLADLANYNNKVKKSITINSITIPSGNDITLRANDFIELKPGFEVQTGRELYLDVSPCP